MARGDNPIDLIMIPYYELQTERQPMFDHLTIKEKLDLR